MYEWCQNYLESNSGFIFSTLVYLESNSFCFIYKNIILVITCNYFKFKFSINSVS